MPNSQPEILLHKILHLYKALVGSLALLLFGKKSVPALRQLVIHQVINHPWDGHKLSYDLAVLFTGKMDFVDGDGYAYIGGICQQ